MPASKHLDSLDKSTQEIYLYCVSQAVRGNTLPLIETFFKIRTKQNQMHPMKLLPSQQEFWQQRSPADIVVKAAQLGISTINVADFFGEALVIPGLEVLIVAQRDPLALRMKDAIDNFYLSIPEPLRPSLLTNNQYVMEIDHSTYSAGMKSTITVGSAESKTIGRGQPIHRLLATEVAFYEDKSLKVLDGIIARMPVGFSRRVLESTADGQEGFFFETFESARNGKNAYRAHFYGWPLEPGYRIPIGSEPRWGVDITRTEEEQVLAERYRLDDDQLRWRRMQIALLGPSMFRQEFPINADEAFLPIGASVFTESQSDAASRYVTDPISVDDGVLVYKDAEAGRPYILAIDQASGEQRDDNERPLDFQSFTIWDAITLEQMVSFREREITARQFAEKCARWSAIYNEALIVPESNLAKFGFIDWLYDAGISNIYTFKATSGRTSLGYPVNVATKPALKDNFADILDTGGGITIRSSNLAREVRNYRYHKGKGKAYMGAAPGGNDDELMTAFFACDPTVREQARMYSGRAVNDRPEYTTVIT